MTTRMVLALGLLVGLSARAQAVTNWYAIIDGLQESPPVATPGTGTGTASFDPNTNLLTVNVAFSGLIGTTTDSHIHCCFSDPPSRNIGVAIGFPAHGFPIGVTSGVFSAAIDLSVASNFTNSFITNFGGGTVAGARAALLAGMTAGTAYFNIHSTFRPGGEIRGDTIPIPEPTSLAILLTGMMGLTLRRRVL
jgi:CHRD domain